MYSILVKSVLLTAGLLFFSNNGLAENTKPGEERPEVSKYAKVYISDNLTITMVRFGAKDSSQTLIKFSGIEHRWDGKIILHKVKEGNNRADINVNLNGKKWTTISVRGQWWGGSSFEVYLPNDSGKSFKPFYVYLDNTLSKEVNTQHFLTEYLKQTKEKKKEE